MANWTPKEGWPAYHKKRKDAGYIKPKKTKEQERQCYLRKKAKGTLYKPGIAEGMLSRARNRAKNKGIPFDITLDDIKVPEFCPVLGIKLEPTKGKLGASSPSLDRIVPSLGYIPGNIVVISMRANRIKCDASADELRAIADWLEGL